MKQSLQFFSLRIIQEVSLIVCASMIVMLTCISLALIESLNAELEKWVGNFHPDSFQVFMYPSQLVENRERNGLLEGMSLFAPPDDLIKTYEPTEKINSTEWVYFTSENLNAIRRIKHVESIAWSRPSLTDIEINETAIPITLVTPDYFKLAGLEILKGVSFAEQNENCEALVGLGVFQILSSDYDTEIEGLPSINILGNDCKIVGVLAPAGKSRGVLQEGIDLTVFMADNEPLDFTRTSRPTALPVSEIWVKTEDGFYGKVMSGINEYLYSVYGDTASIFFLSNKEYLSLIGGIQARLAYQPKVTPIIILIVLVSMANIGIVIFSLLQQNKYSEGIKRSIGASKRLLIKEQIIKFTFLGVATTLLGLAFAYFLSPPVGAYLQNSRFFEALPVRLGFRSIALGAVIGFALWNILVFITSFYFYNKAPVELLRDQNNSFISSNGRRLLSEAGLILSVATLFIMLGLRDSIASRYNEILGWVGGERAGSVVDWNTKGDSAKIAALSTQDYMVLASYFPEANFGWLGRKGNWASNEIVEASASMSTMRLPHYLVGGWFSYKDELEKRPVIVLGYEIANKVAEQLNIPIQNLIGRTWNNYFIVGVMKEWPQGYSLGYRPDLGYVPVGTLGSLDYGAGGQVAFIAPEGVEIAAFIEQVENVLTPLHPEGKLQFISASGVVADALAWKLYINSLLTSFSIVCIFIGGLSFTNLLILWIVGRLRVFGIYRACGYTRTKTLTLIFSFALRFALEAVVIGSILGITVALLIQYVSTYPLTIYAYSILLSVGLALIIAFLFGLLPAIWVSRRSPIELLRMEH